MVANKKTKSHSKPSVNKGKYKKSLDTLGIDIESYGPKRPQPIIVYRIYCHYKKTLDHSKYPWAKRCKYADDAYSQRLISDNVCIQLEQKYPNWYFMSVMEFVNPDTPVINGNTLPVNIIYDVNMEESTIYNKLISSNKNASEKLKKQVLKDAGIDDTENVQEESVKVPVKKQRKSRKTIK